MMGKVAEKRLKDYWNRRLPGSEDQIERFAKVGLLPQDTNLSTVELVCACSLMLEKATIFEALGKIDRYRVESIAEPFGAEFYNLLADEIVEMERMGMRSMARKLRKFGHQMAMDQKEIAWSKQWQKETTEKDVSAIKDEPFLPQRG